jgi:hypothetical protein
MNKIVVFLFLYSTFLYCRETSFLCPTQDLNNKVDLFFVNDYSQTTVQVSDIVKNELEDIIKNENNLYDDKCFKLNLAYNQDGVLIKELLERYEDKQINYINSLGYDFSQLDELEKNKIFEAFSTLLFGADFEISSSLEQSVADYFKSSYEETKNEVLNNSTYQGNFESMVEKIAPRLKENRVILFGHGQGSFYVNKIYENILGIEFFEKNLSDAFLKRIGVIHTNPAINLISSYSNSTRSYIKDSNNCYSCGEVN